MGDIIIYGPIGTERNEVSVQNVRAQLEANKDEKEIVVHLVSPGGDVFEGYSIYNALKNSGKKIITHIEGVCASIATLIAGAGEHIVMNRTAQFMIHNPAVQNLTGTADSKRLRGVANQLDQIKTLLIDVYERRTNLSKEELWTLYDNETWLTSAQAQEMGFVDESVDAIKAVATINLKTISAHMETSQKPGLIDRVVNFLFQKVKNEYSETLQDGTIVVIMSEDGDFTGKQILFEDGSPVPAGEHVLASGKTLIVDENSTITEVREPEVADNSQIENDMEKDKEIENLKAQLAEAQARADKAVAEAATAKATQTKFENRLSSLEKDLMSAKEQLTKTTGDTTPPAKGPVFKNHENPAQDFDPMGEEVKNILKSRNRI